MAERPTFRPVASPVSTVGRTRAYTPGPAPAAPQRPIAPAMERLPAPPDPNGSSTFSQLARGLSAANPGIEKFLNYRQASLNYQDESEATLRAIRDDVTNWAGAVEKDPTLADQSPYFRQVYKDRVARTQIQKEAGRAFAEYYSSDIANSEDPAAIQTWLADRFKPVIDSMEGNERISAADELERITTDFTQTHQKVALGNLLENNRDSFGIALSTAIDNHIERHGSVNRSVLTQELHALEAEAKLQGIGGRELNDLVTEAVSSAMVATGETGLQDILRAKRPDGTPGAGMTLKGREALANAEATLLSKAVQQENLAWTREQRQRELEKREWARTTGNFLAKQAAEGKPVILPEEFVKQAFAQDPEIGMEAIQINKALQDYSQIEDPVTASQSMQPYYSGSGTTEDVLQDVKAGNIKNMSTITRAFEEARRNEENSILSEPEFAAGRKELETLFKVDPLTNIAEDPDKAAAAFRLLKNEMIDWSSKNQGAGPLEINNKVNEVLDAIKANPALAPSPTGSLTIRGEEGSVKDSTPKRADVQTPVIQTSEPSSWSKVTMFDSTQQLDQEYQAYLRGDTQGNFARMLVQNNITTPEDLKRFYETQLRLLEEGN